MHKKKRAKFMYPFKAAALSLLIAGSFSMNVRANVLDDVKGILDSAAQSVSSFLNDIGIGPVLKEGYDTVTDFIFTYETQPDDDQMESLARSWALTAWLADEERKETNTYYFDNHTLTMLKDPSKIGRGYNLKKTPEGSSLNGKHSGILKAVVTDATNYNVEWVNYDDEVNLYLLEQMKAKNGNKAGTAAQTEGAQEENTQTVSAQEESAPS